MTTIAQLEQQLMSAAVRSDMATITSIVNSLTVKEKVSIDAEVLEGVLVSIACFTELNPVASARTMRTFLRAVGPYITSAVLSDAVRVAPRQVQLNG